MSYSPASSFFELDVSDETIDQYPWLVASTESESPPKKPTRTLAPNLTRRAHKKSRGGCFNCKSRKIKCQETRPSCENCLGKELRCNYPSSSDQKIIRRSSCPRRPGTTVTAAPAPRLSPSPSPPTSFSMDDMRCFHHFLTVAYPHLPLGNDSVWVQDIPVFAQQHDYLMHALLALGASHLTRVSPNSDYSTAAIIHRGQAIKGLNQALARGITQDYGQSDAMLASCYALTFQASYMGDGMADFIAMVRGCALLTEQINHSQSTTAFNLSHDIHYRLMAPRLDDMPALSPSLTTPAIVSTESLAPLLRTTVDHNFHSSLLSVMFALQRSSSEGYLNFIRIYGTLFDLSHDQFNVFIDPENSPAQLLMAHFIALQMLMAPLSVHEWPTRGKDASKVSVVLGTVEWGERIFERQPLEMRPYLLWPRQILAQVRKEVEAIAAGTYRLIEGKILAP